MADNYHIKKSPLQAIGCCLQGRLFLYIRCRILFRSLPSSRWLFLYLFLVFKGYTCQFRVNHDTSAIFANDDFLTRTDIQLSLGRDFVEATTTSITLYIYDTQSIARVLTDTLERLKQARFNLGFKLFGFVSQLFFFLLGFRDDFVQFVLLDVQVFLSFFQRFCALCSFSRFLLFLCSKLFDSSYRKAPFPESGIRFLCSRSRTHGCCVHSPVVLCILR